MPLNRRSGKNCFASRRKIWNDRAAEICYTDDPSSVPPISDEEIPPIFIFARNFCRFDLASTLQTWIVSASHSWRRNRYSGSRLLWHQVWRSWPLGVSAVDTFWNWRYPKRIQLFLSIATRARILIFLGSNEKGAVVLIHMLSDIPFFKVFITRRYPTMTQLLVYIGKWVAAFR